MAVDNKILRVQLRDGALTNFDPDRIYGAVQGAAKSVGGFAASRGEINEFMYLSTDDDHIGRILADMVVMCINRDPRYHVPNFPPHIEEVQDTIIHVLRSYGFVDVADVYEVFRWGKHWVREGHITREQFVHNGFPEEKMREVREFNARHGCDTIAGLNEAVRAGKAPQIIDESVARYEQDLDLVEKRFVDRVNRGDPIRLILVAGPSSSGKTTTTVKILTRLMKRGVKIQMMNLDDYFWPISQHPTDWIADRDFETPHALDYNLINRHIKALLAGDEIQMPRYDFKTGSRIGGTKLRIEKEAVLLLDCLHGLYPALTAGIDEHMKFRVYLENMNVVAEGLGRSGRTIRFTDVRLLRRMVRDKTHRNHKPLMTLLHWEKVRKSELANIIPFWGKVDQVVNGGLTFELPALKPFIASIYPDPSELDPYHQLADARLRYQRVKELLSTVEPLDEATIAHIPGDCLIREFIGGGTLTIPHNE